MARFVYSAYRIDDPSVRVEGERVEASSAQDAIQIVQRRGYQPISLKEVGAGLELPKVRSLRRQVKDQQLGFATRQMATMIRSGMSPIETFEVLESNSSNLHLTEALGDVREAINQGKTPAQAMAEHPEIFDEEYISLVRAGQAGGDLPGALYRLADSLDRRAQMKREVRSALTYPLTILLLSAVIVIGLLIFVVPTFEEIFADLDSELPAMTQMLVSASDFIKSPLGIIALFVVPPALWLAFRQWTATPAGKLRWDTFKLNLRPRRLSHLIEMLTTARMMRSLATLYGSGIPIIEALNIAGPTSGNEVIKLRVAAAAENIQQGAKITAALRKYDCIPDMASAMLAAGERAGDVAAMMEKVAEVYEGEVESAVRTIKSIIEPGMMLVVGVVVGVVVISLYQPLFTMYDLI